MKQKNRFQICGITFLMALLLSFLMTGCASHHYVGVPREVQSMTLHRLPQCNRYVTLTEQEQNGITSLLKNPIPDGCDCPPPLFVLEVQYKDGSTDMHFFLAETGEFMGHGLSKEKASSVAHAILRVAARLEKDGHPPPGRQGPTSQNQ